jgi:hypothetical protein
LALASCTGDGDAHGEWRDGARRMAGCGRRAWMEGWGKALHDRMEAGTKNKRRSRF